MSGKRTPDWTSADDIRAVVQNLWDRGRLLAARIAAEPLFPLDVSLRQPGSADMGEQFDAVRLWIRALEAGSSAARGRGYALAWREINHRQLGRQRIPAAALIPTEADALHLIGRSADARRFDQLAQLTLEAFPQLEPWLRAQPLKLLEHAAAWERILAILRWFVSHPRPGLYLRQLDIEGVDSKFIETRKGLLSELLDCVLPAEAVMESAAGARQFEARYGLLGKPALIRFRMLDPALRIGGLSDLTVPVAQFAGLRAPPRRVFITENEINALAFPDVASSMVIFGGGYGIDRLAQIEWLRHVEILYWGDIDTHGFAILDRLRATLPQARSLLMDAATLHAHRLLWVAEDADKRYLGELSRLTDAERALFTQLRHDIHGSRIRLEQERIGYAWVTDAIGAV